MLLQDTTPVGSKDYTDSCITFNTTLRILGSTYNVKKICRILILTLQVPIVTNINFLLTKSIDCQEQSLRELIK